MSASSSSTASERERTSFVGMAVFLGGWTMLFATLLFVWADVRLSSPAWPPDGEPRAPIVYPALATIFIAASSWLLARHRIRATIVCGVAFVALQLAGLVALWHAGVTPSSGRYGSLLYTFLALHAVHVVVGLAGLVLARAASARNWARFWHFVGAVWLALFCALYLAGCSTPESRGRDAYEAYCRPCHGENGDGRGFSSLGLRPPPRDFTNPIFKFGHVVVGQLPPDSELERIIRKGLNGTAMLPWDVSDRELHDVVQYIKRFSPRWKQEPQGEAIVPSPDPYGDASAAVAVAKGKEMFQHTCASCHENRALRNSEFCLPGGKQGADCTPLKVLPPDLRCDTLRAVYPGTELTDLYRTIAAGIAGAGMPTWKGQLHEDELWAIVYYVRSLRADQIGCMRSRTGQ